MKNWLHWWTSSGCATYSIVPRRDDWLSIATTQFSHDLHHRFTSHGVYPDSPLELADLNGDGHLDVVAARDANVFWIENLTSLRDLNGDQPVDQEDINRLWTEGDFDGDGRFDSSDLLTAFSYGYHRGQDDDD